VYVQRLALRRFRWLRRVLLDAIPRCLRCEWFMLCTRRPTFVFVGMILLVGFLCTGAVLPDLGELGVSAFFKGKRARGSCRHLPLLRGLRRTTPPPRQSCWYSDCNCFTSLTAAPLSSTAATSSCGCRLVVLCCGGGRCALWPPALTPHFSRIIEQKSDCRHS
jgi:hypothetical protein